MNTHPLMIIRHVSVSDRHIKMALDQQLAPLGLNSSHHMFLFKIGEHPNITQDKLINLFHIHPSNIARGLATLEKKGFISREPSKEDKRTSHLHLTPKGEEAHHAIKAIIDELHQSLLKGFSPEEEQILNTLLHRLSDNAVNLVK